MKKAISTVNAPKAVGPYSQAVKNGNFIYTSGQICLNKKGEKVNNTVDEEIKQIMENLHQVLIASGVSFDDVVKTTIYVTDMSDYPKVNEIYASFLKEPFPARETICVKDLPLGARVEISMIAVKT